MPPKCIPSDLIESEIFPDYPDMAAQFHEQGYIVIDGIVSQEKCDEIEQLFWDFIESVSPSIDRNDTTTWNEYDGKKCWPVNTRGLIQNYNVGFQRFGVESRMAIKKVFEDLYSTDDLVTSFDGVSFTQNPKVFKYKNLEDWETKCWDKDDVHIDQTTLGFRCIQGGLAVRSQEKNGHVFVCIPGSHKYHKDIVKTVPKKDIHSEWYKFTEDNKSFMKEKGLAMKRIPMKAGSVILWDSRLAHSSTSWCKDAKKNNRLQVFVCMKPASCLNSEERKIRQKAYTLKRASRHLPDHVSLFALNPRYYGPISGYIEYNIPESCEMSEPEKKLHGLI